MRDERDVEMTQDLALPDDYMTGLEDFTPSASMPRIQIVHDKGVFKDALTDEEFELLYGIPLGLIKQRVMWHPKVEDGDMPQCKSNDGDTGYPNIKGPTQKCMFPFQRSGINLDILPRDEFRRPTIACEGCPHTQWTKDPEDGKRVPPACAERYTIPILYSTTEGGDIDRAGIVSFQKSGITPAKNYIQGFARAKQPLFSSFVTIRLETAKRGTVVYSTPKFKRGGPVSQAEFPNYVQQYREIRELLRNPPRPSDEEVEAVQGAQVIQEVPVTTVQATAGPVGTTVPNVPVVDAQAVVNAVSTPVSVPPQQAQPTQPVATQPVVAPAWAAPASSSDDDLPF